MAAAPIAAETFKVAAPLSSAGASAGESEGPSAAGLAALAGDGGDECSASGEPAGDSLSGEAAAGESEGDPADGLLADGEDASGDDAGDASGALSAFFGAPAGDASGALVALFGAPAGEAEGEDDGLLLGEVAAEAIPARATKRRAKTTTWLAIIAVFESFFMILCDLQYFSEKMEKEKIIEKYCTTKRVSYTVMFGGFLYGGTAPEMAEEAAG